GQFLSDEWRLFRPVRLRGPAVTRRRKHSGLLRSPVARGFLFHALQALVVVGELLHVRERSWSGVFQSSPAQPPGLLASCRPTIGPCVWSTASNAMPVPNRATVDATITGATIIRTTRVGGPRRMYSSARR